MGRAWMEREGRNRKKEGQASGWGGSLVVMVRLEKRIDDKIGEFRRGSAGQARVVGRRGVHVLGWGKRKCGNTICQLVLGSLKGEDCKRSEGLSK